MIAERQHSVTLKTVAQAAKCSTAVASTVLNGSRGNTKVSDETRRHVLEVARRLDYRVNHASRSLRTNRSFTLGVYVQPNEWRELSNQYEMAIFKGIERAARESGYDLLVLNISSRNLPEICAQRLRAKQIDGVLLLHCDPGAPWIDQLLAASSCVVAVDYTADHPQLNRVEFDNRAAIRMAAEELYRHGHRRIGFLGSSLAEPEFDARLRETAFRELVKELGLDPSPELIFNCHNTPRPVTKQEPYCRIEGVEALHYFAALPEPPTAILSYNTQAAVHLLREAENRGIAIPARFSVIGVDSSDLLDFARPRLTVVDHCLPKLGGAAVKLLVEAVEGTLGPQPAVRRFGPALIPGESIRTIEIK